MSILSPLSMSLRCYVLCIGCHWLPTPYQHLVFPLWNQLPGSAKIRTPDKQNNPCVQLRKKTEQMGNCFLTPWKPRGFLSFSYPAPRKQDLSGIFVKNKVPQPTAEKLLIHCSDTCQELWSSQNEFSLSLIQSRQLKSLSHIITEYQLFQENLCLFCIH